MLAEVEPLLKRNLPAGHIAFAVLAFERALNVQAEGNLRKALSLAETSNQAMIALAGKGRAPADYQGSSLAACSGIEIPLGRADGALCDASQAMALFQKAALPGGFSADAGHAYLLRGRALQAQGKREEARAAFRAAAENLEDTRGPKHPNTREACQLVAPSGQ